MTPACGPVECAGGVVLATNAKVESSTVLVAGAGPTGLTLACGLLASGVSVR